MGSLRLLLAFAVAASHSPFGAIPGFSFLLSLSAVEVFFIISGFFITMVLNENPAYASTRTFYASRYSRLWPMYIVCALVTLLLNQSNPLSFKDYGHSYFEFFNLLDLPSKLFVLFANATLVFQDWFMFLQVDPQTASLTFTPDYEVAAKPPVYAFLWIAQGWSLGIELVFYALAPFVARHPLRLALLVAVGFLGRYLTYLYFGVLTDPWYSRFVVSEMALFGLGGLGYHVYARFGFSSPAVQRVGIAALAIAVVLVAFRGLLGPLQPWFAFGASPISMWDPFLILFMVLFVPAIFAATRANRIDRALGDLSYPVYLSHVGVGAMLSNSTAGPINGNLLYIALMVAVSIGLVFGIDRPLTRWRSRSFGAHALRASAAPA